jgi:hypothetical protein
MLELHLMDKLPCQCVRYQVEPFGVHVLEITIGRITLRLGVNDLEFTIGRITVRSVQMSLRTSLC